MTYSLSVVLAKLSLLFLYLRLSPDRNFRILVISLIGIVIVYSVQLRQGRDASEGSGSAEH